MQITSYQAKYFAHELTKRCSSDTVEKFTSVLADAQLDLNLHQVEKTSWLATVLTELADNAAREKDEQKKCSTNLTRVQND
jgi:hypothetical protein